MALSAILARVSLDTRQYDEATQKMIKQAQKLSGEMRRIGQDLTYSLSLPLAAGGAAALNAFKEYDSLKRALSTLEPTADSVSKRLLELSEIARQPGLSFKEAIAGDVRLRAVGISAERSARILKEFGNAIAQTGGGADELNRIIIQLPQLAAKGKVLAQDLKPIIDAAPAVGKALLEMYGAATSEKIQEILESQGKNSVQFIDELLNKLSEAPRVSGGFKNAIENIVDSLFRFGAAIGESINDTFKLDVRIDALAQKLDVLGRSYQNLNPYVKDTIVATGGVAASIGPALFSIGKLSQILGKGGSLSRGLEILTKLFTNFSGKGVASLLKMGGVTLVITTLIQSFDKIKAAVIEVINDFKKLYENSLIFRAGVILLWKTLSVLYESFKGILNIVADLGDVFVSLLLDSMKATTKAIKALFGEKPSSNLRDYVSNTSDAFRNLRITILETWASLNGKVTTGDITDGIEALNNAVAESQSKLLELSKTTDNLKIKKIINNNDLKNVDDFTQIINTYNKSLLTSIEKNKIFGDSFDILTEEIKTTEKAINDLIELGTNKAKSEIPKLTEKFNKLKAELKDREINKILSDTSDEFSRLSSLEPLFGNSLDGQIKSLQNLAENLYDAGALSNEILNRIQNQILSNKLVIDRRSLKIDNKIFEDLEDFRIPPLKGDPLKDVTNKINSQIATMRANFKEFGKIDPSNLDKFMNNLGRILARVNEIGGVALPHLYGIIQQGFENRSIELDNYYEKEKKKIEKSRLGEEAKAAALQKLDEDVNLKRRRIQRDQAIAAKKQAIFEAIINGANSVVKAFSIGGPILAGVVSGLVAKQIAVIKQQPIPALASGGLAYGDTLALVGDNPNASTDPEVIAPLSKLKNLIRDELGVGSGVSVIRGGDIHIVAQNQLYLDRRLR